MSEPIMCAWCANLHEDEECPWCADGKRHPAVGHLLCEIEDVPDKDLHTALDSILSQLGIERKDTCR